MNKKTEKLLNPKKNRVCHETIFEMNFKDTCPLFNCWYEKHADPINMRERKKVWDEKKQKVPEVKRAYDGELSTPIGNFPLEFKYGKNWLLTHQDKYAREVTRINKLFFILVKRTARDSGYLYSIKNVNKEIIFSADNTAELVKWFCCKPANGIGMTLHDYIKSPS